MKFVHVESSCTRSDSDDVILLKSREQIPMRPRNVFAGRLLREVVCIVSLFLATSARARAPVTPHPRPSKEIRGTIDAIDLEASTISIQCGSGKPSVVIVVEPRESPLIQLDDQVVSLKDLKAGMKVRAKVRDHHALEIHAQEELPAP